MPALSGVAVVSKTLRARFGPTAKLVPPIVAGRERRSYYFWSNALRLWHVLPPEEVPA